jgi:hypothetical protein
VEWSDGEVASQRNRQQGTSTPLLQNQDLDVYTVHTTECKQQGSHHGHGVVSLPFIAGSDRWRWMRVPYHYQSTTTENVQRYLVRGEPRQASHATCPRLAREREMEGELGIGCRRWLGWVKRPQPQDLQPA